MRPFDSWLRRKIVPFTTVFCNLTIYMCAHTHIMLTKVQLKDETKTEAIAYFIWQSCVLHSVLWKLLGGLCWYSDFTSAIPPVLYEISFLRGISLFKGLFVKTFCTELWCIHCPCVVKILVPNKHMVSVILNDWDIFYYHGLTLIPAWISNYMSGKVWDEITYPFLNLNGTTVEV